MVRKRFLITALQPSRSPLRTWEVHFLRACTWWFPFLIGSLLGLVVVELVYLPGRISPLIVIGAVLSLGTLGTIWVKRPSLRQPLLSLFLFGVAGLGGTVSGLLFASGHAPGADLGTNLLAAFGIPLLIGGICFGKVFRAH
jgi:hypothetical protein